MKIQHVKAVVQHVFNLVDDNGNVVNELIPDPVTVFGKDWARYSAEQFPKDVEAFEGEALAQATRATNGKGATAEVRQRSG